MFGRIYLSKKIKKRSFAPTSTLRFIGAILRPFRAIFQHLKCSKTLQLGSSTTTKNNNQSFALAWQLAKSESIRKACKIDVMTKNSHWHLLVLGQMPSAGSMMFL